MLLQDEIIKYTKLHKLDCTIYVDDITISSIRRDINRREESETKTIIGLTNFADISVKGKYMGLREAVNKLKIIENV